MSDNGFQFLYVHYPKIRLFYIIENYQSFLPIKSLAAGGISACHLLVINSRKYFHAAGINHAGNAIYFHQDRQTEASAITSRVFSNIKGFSMQNKSFCRSQSHTQAGIAARPIYDRNRIHILQCNWHAAALDSLIALCTKAAWFFWSSLFLLLPQCHFRLRKPTMPHW